MKLLVLNIFLLLALSCNYDSQKQIIPKNVKNHFHEEDLIHFPPANRNFRVIIRSYYLPYVKANHKKGGYIKVLYSLQKDDFLEMRDSLPEKSIAILSPNDNRLIPIFRNNGILEDSSFAEKTEFYPIPTFAEELDYLNRLDVGNLPDDFTLYILECKEGIFMDKEKIEDSKFLSLIMEHGKSRGVALSEKRLMAIFWTDVW